MGLHEELDPQPEPTGCQIIHLLADAVPQIQPQVFSFAACELQPKVVYFDYAQLSANLKKGKTSGGSQKTDEVRREAFHHRTVTDGEELL